MTDAVQMQTALLLSVLTSSTDPNVRLQTMSKKHGKDQWINSTMLLAENKVWVKKAQANEVEYKANGSV